MANDELATMVTKQNLAWEDLSLCHPIRGNFLAAAAEVPQISEFAIDALEGWTMDETFKFRKGNELELTILDKSDLVPGFNAAVGNTIIFDFNNAEDGPNKRALISKFKRMRRELGIPLTNVALRKPNNRNPTPIYALPISPGIADQIDQIEKVIYKQPSSWINGNYMSYLRDIMFSVNMKNMWKESEFAGPVLVPERVIGYTPPPTATANAIKQAIADGVEAAQLEKEAMQEAIEEPRRGFNGELRTENPRKENGPKNERYNARTV